MTIFRQQGNSIFVACYGLEVYLPYDYLNKEYRGTSYYSIVGDKVRYYALGNMRPSETKADMEKPFGNVYTLGFPMIITSEPTEIDIRDVQFVRGGVSRKCIVLTFYKDDLFVENVDCIAASNNIMILMNRLEGGKLDHVLPSEAVQIFRDCQEMNKANLRIPSEEEEIFIAERYRDPEHPSRRARFSDSLSKDKILSYNMRQEAMQTTTYQALTHEDINTSLITSINRKKSGIRDQATIMERLVRGLPMDDLIEDRDKRLAEESQGKKTEKIVTTDESDDTDLKNEYVD